MVKSEYLATSTSNNNKFWAYPLTSEHGAPKEFGDFEYMDGKKVKFERAPVGLISSESYPDDAARYKLHILDFVQNRFAVKVENHINLAEPLLLADGRIRMAESVEAVIRITLSSLADFPDFIAQMGILTALYKYVGMKNDIEVQTEIASKMVIEEGMWLPVTLDNHRTNYMRVNSESSDIGCYDVTFFGSRCNQLDFCSGQLIQRVTNWQEQGAIEFQSAEAIIGEII